MQIPRDEDAFKQRCVQAEIRERRVSGEGGKEKRGRKILDERGIA